MSDLSDINVSTPFSVKALVSSVELQFQVEQFYYFEAAALDERRFSDWLALFSDDIHYWMPVRRTRVNSELDAEFTAIGNVAFFDDNKFILQSRVKKLESRTAWSENPPSRTRHFVSNVRILAHEQDTYTVSSNFHVYRTRYDSDEDSWIGRREDILLRTDDSFVIKARKIYLDQTVILSQNLSVLF